MQSRVGSFPGLKAPIVTLFRSLGETPLIRCLSIDRSRYVVTLIWKALSFGLDHRSREDANRLWTDSVKAKLGDHHVDWEWPINHHEANTPQVCGLEGCLQAGGGKRKQMDDEAIPMLVLRV